MHTFHTTLSARSPTASPAVPSFPAPPPAPCKKHPSRHFTYQGVDSGSEIRHQWTGLWAETHTHTRALSLTLRHYTHAHTHIHSAPRSHTDVFKGQHNIGTFVLKEDKHLLPTASSEGPTDYNLIYPRILAPNSFLSFLSHHPSFALSTQSHPCSPLLACKRTLLFYLTFIFLSTTV